MNWRSLMDSKTETYTQYPQKPQKGGSRWSFDTIGDIEDKSEKVKNMSEAGYRFEERAAIMEYDGGLPRQQAEYMAKDILKQEIKNG